MLEKRPTNNPKISSDIKHSIEPSAFILPTQTNLISLSILEQYRNSTLIDLKINRLSRKSFEPNDYTDFPDDKFNLCEVSEKLLVLGQRALPIFRPRALCVISLLIGVIADRPSPGFSPWSIHSRAALL